MTRLMRIEKWCLWGHVLSMAFGLAGLLWVMPHPEILQYLPAGPVLYRWSMAGGGVIYILLGATAVSLYAYRELGLKALLTFLVPAIAISLSSELSGTSTGFPFGDYTYLNGLGYKIAGLVPFTIPLSWFYLGISSYLLARGGLMNRVSSVWRQGAAIAVGALLLMSWDFVLDPAMSQTAMPFWYWHQPGAFFGMPYENFAGWFFTGMIFMAVAATFWRRNEQVQGLTRRRLTLPLVMYLANFAFAMFMSMGGGIFTPILLGLIVGAIPAIVCWLLAPDKTDASLETATASQAKVPIVEMAATPAAASK
ncbi:carotenoid biosynthesis protein [Oscillatoria sp. CS-180]|uniref:gamma-carotene 1'-hydroxylase CruF n=1 Tax=Oscillatoria sp. CS-180 TaxID=3021720 RepID=UPI00232AABDF|nr:carotenoid biosynthesis protein [Oscillatoria sp. CS-180]MDB9528612.1 carotenoid biosynthesis protein [Oscillatoria sp. CS-180]